MSIHLFGPVALGTTPGFLNFYTLDAQFVPCTNCQLLGSRCEKKAPPFKGLIDTKEYFQIIPPLPSPAKGALAGKGRLPKLIGGSFFTDSWSFFACS